MGMGFFKGSSSCYSTTGNSFAKDLNESNTNPDPSKYKILKTDQIGDGLVIKIKYLNCNNYEGIKILFFKDTTLSQLIVQKNIDPHFCDNINYKSPFARFEPTQEGWKEATLLAFRILAATINNVEK